MKALTFELHLTEPLLATQPTSGEENSATSYSFVPGSMLRGALIAAYQRAHPTSDFLNDARARRLFFDGAVRYLNAYPLHVLAKNRMFPLPASWHVKKRDLGKAQTDAQDLALAVADDTQEPDAPPRADDDQELKAPPWEYCLYTSADIVERYNPERYLQVHNASNDRNAKDARSSQVFRYEALAAGQVLGGVILSDATNASVSSDFELLRELLGDAMRLGGSHTAGYGRVEIKNVEERPNWQETPGPSLSREHKEENDEDTLSAPDEPASVVITLLSDAIVRGENGQASANFDDALKRACGIPTLKHTRAFACLRRVGGFNRAAGLPLPQEWALQAGSVFVYDVNALDATQLEALQTSGIGERTVEGFGRIAVNWQSQPAFKLQKLEPLDNRASLAIALDRETRPELAEANEGFAKAMAGRQLRARLERTLIEKINKTIGEIPKDPAGSWKTEPPKNSQLARVRTAARAALYAGDLAPVADLLKGLKGARKQFENARIGSRTLLEWLEARLEGDLDAFRENFAIREHELPRVGKRAPDVEDALRVEFVARWIDGVMQRMQKHNQDQEGR